MSWWVRRRLCNPQKYMVAPKQLPEHRTGSTGESYWTWMSGFALFVVLYLFNAQTFLIDKNVFAGFIGGGDVASPVSLLGDGLLVVYDGICSRVGQRKNGDLIVGAGVRLRDCGHLHCLPSVCRSRAFLLTGAMLATAMSANADGDHPGQKKTVAAMKAGHPDPMHPMRAKQTQAY